MIAFFAEKFARPAPEKKRKTAPAKRRSFTAVSNNRLYKDFLRPLSSADSETEGGIVALRAKARQICRNNAYAQRYLQSLCVGVLGENGLTLQVKARNLPRQGETQGSLDTIGNLRIEQAFRLWSRTVSVDKRYTFNDILQICLKSLARDGEIFLRKVTNGQYQDAFALQFLEADFVDETFNIPSNPATGNRIVMGIELGEFDEPIAYWIRSTKKGSHPYDSQSQWQGRIRIDAKEIIHLYKPDRFNSTRGVSWLSPVMNRLHMLDQYEEAELVASRLGAQKLGFLIQEDGEDFIGDDETDEGEQILHSEPGSIQQLPSGFKFQDWNPDHPVTAFPEFHKAVLRGVSSGLNISFHSISNNLESVNYSSIRQGTIEERDHFRMLQKFLIEHLAVPIALEWLTHWMSFNNNSLPLRLYDKFAPAMTFTGRGYQWIDPLKEIRAEKEAIDLRIKSRSDIISQQGKDIEDTFAQIEYEQTLADKHKITFDEEADNGRPEQGTNEESDE